MKLFLVIATLLLASTASAQITLGPIAIGDTFIVTNVAAGGTCVASGTGTTPNTTCTYGGIWNIHKSALAAVVSQVCSCFPGNTGQQGPIGLTGATGAAGVPGAQGATGATGAAGPAGASVVGPQGAAGLPGSNAGTRVVDSTGALATSLGAAGTALYLWDASSAAFWRIDWGTGAFALDVGTVAFTDSSCTHPVSSAATFAPGIVFWDNSTNAYYVGTSVASTATTCWARQGSSCVLDFCLNGANVQAAKFTALPTAATGAPFSLAH